MSDYYRARVVAKKDRIVSIALDIIHPDVELCDEPSFALIVLYESSDRVLRTPRPPLAVEARYDDVVDPAWAERFVRGFVASTRLEGNVLHIEVTHEAWCRHLRVGTKWETRAFPVTRTYRPCGPLAPTGARRAVGSSTADLA